MRPQLWTERPVEDTMVVYTDWAESYDADVGGKGYHTPGRIAAALAQHLSDKSALILDFGCGTGLSGTALRAAGFDNLHGTDITPAMVDLAGPKGIYRKLWVSVPGELDASPGQYSAIVAAGVVSLGAAPPETMDMLINALSPGGLLAMSFNDPTLADGRFQTQLETHLAAGRIKTLFRAHGPHLDDMEMCSDVMVLTRL